MRHMAADRVVIRRKAGGQIFHDLILGPRQLGGGDVGDRALARRIGGAPQPARGIQPAQRIARRMTFAAMCQSLGDIAPAGLVRGQITLHHEILPYEHQLPQPQRAADVEGKAHLMRLTGGLRFRQAVHIGLQVDDILRHHLVIGGIGQGGEIVLALGRQPGLNGIGEGLDRPAPDAGLGIGRDIGRKEGAEI